MNFLDQMTATILRMEHAFKAQGLEPPTTIRIGFDTSRDAHIAADTALADPSFSRMLRTPTDIVRGTMTIAGVRVIFEESPR